MRIFRKVSQHQDFKDNVADGEFLKRDGDDLVGAAGGGGGAPTDADYLVGTANGSLSAEIVVGTSPGGELGGTWASPTVDATHSGSSHAGVQAAAEATAAAALLAHTTDATDAHAGTAITNTPAGNVAATTVQAAINELDTEKAAASHAHAGEDITSGTVADARIASTIARDSEVTSAISALSSVYQAKDTTLDTYAGIDPSANVQSVLSAADYAAIRTLLGLVIGTNVQAYDADLTTYAGISPSANVQSVLSAADYAAIRALLDLEVGTDVQAHDAELAALAGLTSAADRVPVFSGSGTAALSVFNTAVQSYTPALTASSSNPTLGSGSAAAGTYVQIGKLVMVWAGIVFGSSGAAAGSGTYRISLPVACNTGLSPYAGSVFLFKDGVGSQGICAVDGANQWVTIWSGNTNITHAFFSAPASDQIHINVAYIAA